MKGSWRSTSLGVLALITAFATGLTAILDGDPKTTLDIETILAAITGLQLGVLGLVTRDNKVTSREAGAER